APAIGAGLGRLAARDDPRLSKVGAGGRGDAAVDDDRSGDVERRGPLLARGENDRLGRDPRDLVLDAPGAGLERREIEEAVRAVHAVDRAVLRFEVRELAVVSLPLDPEREP